MLRREDLEAASREAGGDHRMDPDSPSDLIREVWGIDPDDFKAFVRDEIEPGAIDLAQDAPVAPVLAAIYAMAFEIGRKIGTLQRDQEPVDAD